MIKGGKHLNIIELKKYSSLITEHKSLLIQDWLSYAVVIETLEQYIKIEQFQVDYATAILQYYIDVIDGKKQIGNCPIMNRFLELFSDKDVPVHELYIICSHMRIVLIDFAFDYNITSKNLLSQVNYIADQNLTGTMKRYKEIFDTKAKEAKEYASILKQYKEAIDQSSIVSKTNKEGRIIFVNDNFCKISGYSREELIGQPHNIVRHDEMPAEEFENLWSTIKSKKSWTGVLKNKAKNAKPYYVNTIIFPILDIFGEIVEYMSIRHDLTELFELNTEMEETQKEIIYKMGEIGETRSKETGNHVKRVAKYSGLLARYIGLEEDEINILVSASPMHDIGKVGIPDAILKKPGKLTPDEWEIMKTHSEIGHKILKNSKRPIIKAAAIVSQQHHEKWDGSGYPRGIKGEEIHIYGRITAVADVFDALGSDRVYKKAWVLEDILEYFKEQNAKQFDPKLTQILFDNIDDFLIIRDSYLDVV